jgi:hypothetical protein
VRSATSGFRIAKAEHICVSHLGVQTNIPGRNSRPAESWLEPRRNHVVSRPSESVFAWHRKEKLSWILFPVVLEIFTKHRFQIGRHGKQSHGFIAT